MLAFGVLMTFSSSFGQTFFIGLFNEVIRDSFGLSHAAFGTIYLVATLSSAATIIWAGLKIDDMELRRYASLICVGLAVAALTMALAPHWAVLLIAIYGLRLCGQGLMGHTATVAMARYMGKARGQALSISALGMPLGEALFPILVVALLAVIDWRLMWAGIAAFAALGLIPLVWGLLIGQTERDAALKARQSETGNDNGTPALRQRDLIRQPMFLAIMPHIMAAPFILTGVFFHQVALSDGRGWDETAIGLAIVFYAAMSITASLISGRLTDMIGAYRLLPLVTMPMGLGLLLFTLLDAQAVAPFFMGLFGLTTGLSITVVNAFWAELYGVAKLGAVRALVSSIMVLSTALAPPLFGLALDLQLDVTVISTACAAYVVLALALAATQLRRVAGIAAANRARDTV